MQDLARAHVAQRVFGPSADWLAADALFAGVLERDLDGVELLRAYAEELPSVVALPASRNRATPPQVRSVGTVAVIGPGAAGHDIALPTGTTAVVVDLRALPPGTDVEAAVSLALGEAVTVGQRQVRRFLGFPAQNGGEWTHYESSQVLLDVVVPGNGEADLPLALLVGEQLTPVAATVAGGLRMAGRALIVGKPIDTRIAESTWSGIGNAGLLWRSSLLQWQGQPWPDQIPADVPTDDPRSVLDSLGKRLASPIPALRVAKASRARFKTYDRSAGAHPGRLDHGVMRASLLVAYGTVDWFYPLDQVVGRDYDSGLLRALAEVQQLEPDDRPGFRMVLDRWLVGLEDSHTGVIDEHREDWELGAIAVRLQPLEGRPIVRLSAEPGVNAGDEILKIDCVPARPWLDARIEFCGGATPAARWISASAQICSYDRSRTLELRAPDGATRTVSFAVDWSKPIPEEAPLPFAGVRRPSGWIDGPGGESRIYYANLSDEVTPEPEELLEKMPEVLGRAQGLILDMRAYPNPGAHNITCHLHSRRFPYATFGIGTWTGPEHYEFRKVSDWFNDPVEPYFAGPVALLVSHRSISSAELLCMWIERLPNVTVIGQTSAASNGTITQVLLPGGFQMTYTGMRLLYPDGSDLHAIGIVPDIVVEPDPAQLAKGVDPELRAAVDHLRQEK